jgi:ubiquinone/menaquinone biosynthesis C-methylase UbiE
LKRISFDPVAEVFDKTRGPPDHVMKQLLKILEKELRGCNTILDAGVGTGRFAKPMQERGFEVVGIDISRKMINVAKEKGTANLLRGDVCALPFKDGSFDAAICNAVLHLIPEWQTALREVCRATTRVVVSTSHECTNPVRDEYSRLLEEYGYRMPKRGRPLEELKSFVKPSRSIHVAKYCVNTAESLANMNQRVFSHQWNVARPLHNKVMIELRRRIKNKRYQQNLRVLTWNARDVALYLRE